MWKEVCAKRLQRYIMCNVCNNMHPIMLLICTTSTSLLYRELALDRSHTVSDFIFLMFSSYLDVPITLPSGSIISMSVNPGRVANSVGVPNGLLVIICVLFYLSLLIIDSTVFG